MSQVFSQLPRQVLQQQQRLTPQLIQAMDILQLNAMALEARINQELDGNPALEVVQPDDEVGSDSAPDAASTGEDEPGDSDFERLDDLVREYDWLDDEYAGVKSRTRLEEEGEAKFDAMANTAARPRGLQEHLLEQWALTDVDDDIRRAGQVIIESLDDVGRLTTPLDELRRDLPAPIDAQRMEAALLAVQELDPPGVAARDLRECLLLQLRALPGDTSLEARIIQEHWEDLRRNRLPAIARGLGVEIDEVKAAIEVISHLSLHPGSDITDHQTAPVIPDVIVEYDETMDGYTVRLARANQRELRISPEFREALTRSRDDKRLREFVKEKIEAANSIIEAIRYRRERLLEVAKAVVEAQRDFLDHGEQHLRVLRMSDLAQRFGCDPSTISRTVDDKWMQTPRGMFPLRRFFTGGTESSDGEVLGWDSIKAKVQQIVDQEDKQQPLSDDQIVEKLRAEGIDIKRRTVAKYRAQLDIPPARQRRQY